MPIDPEENTEEALPPGFDPIAYWLENKTKIIAFAALLIVGLVAFGAYQITTQQTMTASQNMFAEASKPDDFRQVIAKFPHSIAAGNSELMLASKLRDEKKYDDAIAALHEFINQFPEHPLASTGAFSLAATLEDQGKADEALDAYQQVATKYPSSYAAPIALIAQANLLKSKGKTDEAKRILENVATQYENSYIAQQAQAGLKSLHK